MRILCWRRLLIGGSAAVFFFSAVTSFCQAGAATTPITSQTTENQTPTGQCPRLAETSGPFSGTVEAKVTGLNSAHLKAGKELW
jgi:hypothetical protein